LENNKGSIFVVGAPSGTGKTTIIREIFKIYPTLSFSVSATTRKPRDYETQGKDYFFLSEEEFKKKIELNEFVEWEKFYDYYYGTLKSFIREKMESGISLLLDLDVKGGVNIKKIFPDAVLIYILPPSIEELEKRLRNRNTESEEDFQKRIDRAQMELKFRTEYDYCIVNDKLDKAIEDVANIIKEKLNK
jgi:guanylate kinase